MGNVIADKVGARIRRVLIQATVQLSRYMLPFGDSFLALGSTALCILPAMLAVLGTLDEAATLEVHYWQERI